MAGSTAMASRIDPSVLVDFLNRIFTLIDDLVARHGLEKIKTTGDSHMVVSGIPDPRPDHAVVLAALALDIHGKGTMETWFLTGRIGEFPAGPAICYVVKRNSRGALPVDFRKARAKLAGEEYPSSIDTRVTDPFVCRSNSVAR